MAFEDEQAHLDMYDPSLNERVSKLRALAVKTLTDDPNRTLHLEGNQAIPFVRTLAVPANGAAQDQFEFQFSHLSIQEYFLAVDLVEGGEVLV